MCSGKCCKCYNSSGNGSCESCKDNCEKISSVRIDFDAKEFVDNLLIKGSCVACDESSKLFNNNDLPPFYDEDMFKKGQAFFHKHIFGMFLGNLLGLICGLAIKSSLAILMMTRMSSSVYTAYKRYVATILHMMIWYDHEFKPGSRLWESLKDVKSKHNSASKKSLNRLKYRINQKDMALTQFGFMGFVLTRNKMLGIHDIDAHDLQCFIHVWRVLGYVLGIEDEFNICRESIEETREICEEILQRVMKPAVEARDPEHKEMCSYLINGLFTINPFLNLGAFTFYLEAVLSNSLSSIDKANTEYKKLPWGEKLRLQIIVFVVDVMKFTVIRVTLRHLQVSSLKIAQAFPFLAYYHFGKKNSHVNIMGAH